MTLPWRFLDSSMILDIFMAHSWHIYNTLMTLSWHIHDTFMIHHDTFMTHHDTFMKHSWHIHDTIMTPQGLWDNSGMTVGVIIRVWTDRQTQKQQSDILGSLQEPKKYDICQQPGGGGGQRGEWLFFRSSIVLSWVLKMLKILTFS